MKDEIVKVVKAAPITKWWLVIMISIIVYDDSIHRPKRVQLKKCKLPASGVYTLDDCQHTAEQELHKFEMQNNGVVGCHVNWYTERA